jgi:hypothetical protein
VVKIFFMGEGVVDIITLDTRWSSSERFSFIVSDKGEIGPTGSCKITLVTTEVVS